MARRHLIRNLTYVTEIDVLWQTDFANMQDIARQYKIMLLFYCNLCLT